VNANERLAGIASGVEAGDTESVIRLVEEALSEGLLAATILNDGLVAGMGSLGELFGAGEAFLPELLVAAEALNAAVALLEPLLLADGVAAKGRVVIGTVTGDVHDIGKNLVVMLLRGNGFEVHDLGVDIGVEEFVAATREKDADILALSALLSTTTPEFSTVIDGLAGAGLRERVKVIVGGAPVTAALAHEVGADGYAKDCVGAVAECARLVGTRRQQ
jgi:5-methyltetrahydrofolate--homocysteine methyltransferase